MTPSPSLLHSTYQRSHRIDRLVFSLLWAVLLSACHDSSSPDLQPWLAQVRQQTRPAPLPEMTLPVMPAHWHPESVAADPFGLQLTAQKNLATDPSPEVPRRTIPPARLPAIRAVAILRSTDASRALLQIGARMLLVTPGDTLPGLAGRVLSIDERAVRLELAGREVRLDLGLGRTTANDFLTGAPA